MMARSFSIIPFIFLLVQTCFIMKTISEASPSVITQNDQNTRIAKTDNNATPKSQYPALEFIKRNLQRDFQIRAGHKSNKIKLSVGSKLIYVCPAETDHQVNMLEKYFSQFSNCLYIKQKSKTVLDSIFCDHEIQPYLWMYQMSEVACGNNEEGSRYTYAYEICWESKFLKYTFVTNLKKNSIIRNMKRYWVEIYSVCLSQKQPLYVRYRLSVSSEDPKPEPEPKPQHYENRIAIQHGLETQLLLRDEDDSESKSVIFSGESESEQSTLDIKRIPTTEDHQSNMTKQPSEGSKQIYDEDSANLILPTTTRGTPEAELNFEDQSNLYNKYKTINSGQQFGEGINDYLIPHMLIPPIHLNPDFSKNAPYNYVNVNPMWSSLRKKWQRTDDYIRQLGENKSYSISVYAGIHETLKIDNKDFFMKNEGENKVKLKVSLIWWKLLINKKKSIILAMQNIPKGYQQTTNKLCQQSICGNYGWDDVNELNDATIYCCQFTKEMKTLLSLTVEDIPIGGIFSLKKQKFG